MPAEPHAAGLREKGGEMPVSQMRLGKTMEDEVSVKVRGGALNS